MAKDQGRDGQSKAGFLLLLAGLALIIAPVYNSIFHRSLQGYLLISPDGFPRPFENAVIYIVRHNAYGAYGVVLNKPSPASPEIFIGGPVPSGIQSLDVTGDRRTYEGYAGWGAMQLDRELKREVTWKLLKAEDEILKADPDSMWGLAMDRLQAEAERPAKASRPVMDEG